MKQLQDKLLDKIEELVMLLSFSDKKDKAKGEIMDIQRAIQETRRALEES